MKLYTKNVETFPELYWNENRIKQIKELFFSSRAKEYLIAIVKS
jgi:hypothetical protein